MISHGWFETSCWALAELFYFFAFEGHQASAAKPMVLLQPFWIMFSLTSGIVYVRYTFCLLRY